jgi:hypothetical protein
MSDNPMGLEKNDTQEKFIKNKTGTLCLLK